MIKFCQNSKIMLFFKTSLLQHQNIIVVSNIQSKHQKNLLKYRFLRIYFLSFKRQFFYKNFLIATSKNSTYLQYSNSQCSYNIRGELKMVELCNNMAELREVAEEKQNIEKVLNIYLHHRPFAAFFYLVQFGIFFCRNFFLVKRLNISLSCISIGRCDGDI